MANYKPLAASVSSNSLYDFNGARIDKTINTSAWDLIFLYGTALGISLKISGAIVVSKKVVLKSGTVLGWYNTTAGTVANAAFQTFSDSNGRYGVTINSGHPVTVKFYAHG